MLKSNISVLILQHPQEPGRKDREISTAQLVTQTLQPSGIAIGLSFRNLEHALKKAEIETKNQDLLKPQNWISLYLGTKTQTKGEHSKPVPGLHFLSKKGLPKEKPDQSFLGIILLDGTWSQAKTLWWRNAWLLKTQRAFLVPKEKSLYGNTRKEPRPECVSTLEAVAETLTSLGESLEIEKALKVAFRAQIETFKNK